ncbi:MAG: transporter [Phycisphaerales bacterium]|nr:MAG: transporter [Phycisphaerales bacterium]
MTSRPLALLACLVFAPAAAAKTDGDARDDSLLSSIFGRPAAPLDGPLIGDRPDGTESVQTVPRGRTQIETGYTYTTNKDRGEREHRHEAPEILVRFGLVDNVELRLEWPGYVWTDSDGRSSADGADFGVGMKVTLHDDADDPFRYGVLFGATFPTGGGEATEGDVVPELLLLLSYDLTDRLEIASNLRIDAPISDRGRYLGFGATLALGYELTERVGVYAEYYGFYGASKVGPEHYANTGATYLINDNLQLDARIGAGLNDRADDLFVGAGVIVRF